ncbi:hypothetical protein V6R21_00295 [Limibacter armeniacum]|uniref:hypothetical protein n=1 Tax=Limibacter armeniacum TaxID=466084 RepID=UPI002FE61539
MRKFTSFFVGIAMFLSLVACDQEEQMAAPKITLSKTQVTAKTGEIVTISAHIESEAGVKALVVTPRLDSEEKAAEVITISESSQTMADIEVPYEVAVEDAEGVLVLNFAVVDEMGAKAEAETVFEIELSTTDILTRNNYRWAYVSETIASGENIMSEGKDDTTLAFHKDGSITFDIGEKDADGLETLASYTAWELNEDETVLTLTRVDWLGETTYEEYTLESIDKDELKVSTTVDLSFFGYSENEKVTTTFGSQAYVAE